ncbi:MAG: lysoplasmalogenase [Candidatus Nanopelagicales bacterium]
MTGPAATAPSTRVPLPGVRALLAAAVVVAVVNLAAQVLDAAWVGRVSIWLFMPLLGLWAWTATPRPVPRPLALLLVGTVFAWGGDVFLSLPRDGDLLFLLGIGSFLVMQVLYLLAFRSVPGPGLVRAWPIAWIPYGVFWVGMNALLWPGTGDLRIPVLVYSAALVLMAVAALDLVLRVPRADGWRVAWGAVLFVVSDACIALRAFVDVLPDGRVTSVLIMVTYLPAQLLIVTGFVRAVRAVSRPTGSAATP